IIDKNTKKVVLLNLDNHRLLSTEEIIFTGSVRNIGDYTVGEVEVEIKIMDKGLAGNETRGSNKSTAFEEFFGRNDSDIRPSYMITREVVTTELKPGQTKSFRIPIEYPAYFTGFSDTARVIAH
ncbi:MAG TPA: DUF2393 family protein, partial [Sulfuricurvum sp.]|nr:DUF2393 family protein [Sulfuricurvum sp.]